jgi:hypothetical protein
MATPRCKAVPREMLYRPVRRFGANDAGPVQRLQGFQTRSVSPALCPNAWLTSHGDFDGSPIKPE